MGKLVSVCGDVFKSSEAPGTRASHEFPQEGAVLYGVAFFAASPTIGNATSRRALSLSLFLFYFSPTHFVSLTAFISRRFAHERIPLSISFHFTAAVSAAKERTREEHGGNARHSSMEGIGQRSRDDRRLFEFLRLQAIFQADVDENRSRFQITHVITKWSGRFSLNLPRDLV